MRIDASRMATQRMLRTIGDKHKKLKKERNDSMILVLAEKPSAMRNFAKALGGDEGSYNGESYRLYKTAQLLQNGGLDAAELDSLAANIFMDMDWLQMCTDLAEQMTWECSTERSELAEMLWNGDPEQGIAALEDVAVDDDDCIKQEWMGYKPGTPRFEIWKDFETNFSKDGVSLCELSEFDKLFGSDVREGNVQKDVSDVSWDDPGSEDER